MSSRATPRSCSARAAAAAAAGLPNNASTRGWAISGMLLRLTMSHFDIAVVGGGPAGAWTSFLLATRGARVAILDGSHPREKPCGGGLSARALELLRPLGPSRALPGVVIAAGKFSDG